MRRPRASSVHGLRGGDRDSHGSANPRKPAGTVIGVHRRPETRPQIFALRSAQRCSDFIVGPKWLCRTLGVGARTLARLCHFCRRPRLRFCICTGSMFPNPSIFSNILLMAIFLSNKLSSHFAGLSHPQQSSSASPSCSCPTMPASAVWSICSSRRLPRPATPTMSSLSPPPSPRT